MQVLLKPIKNVAFSVVMKVLRWNACVYRLRNNSFIM